jgi:hypothetical protein
MTPLNAGVSVSETVQGRRWRTDAFWKRTCKRSSWLKNVLALVRTLAKSPRLSSRKSASRPVSSLSCVMAASALFLFRAAT